MQSFVLISMLRGQPKTPPSGDDLAVLTYYLKSTFIGEKESGIRTTSPWTISPLDKLFFWGDFVQRGGGGGGWDIVRGDIVLEPDQYFNHLEHMQGTHILSYFIMNIYLY